ncbi:hypothetical protein NL676_019553 [Syzygium grande]|nr:hypothetical protein NL676_019553 [Syzygium grande]
MTSQLPAFEMIYQYASSSRIAISIRDPVVSLHLSSGLQKMETLEATTNLGSFLFTSLEVYTALFFFCPNAYTIKTRPLLCSHEGGWNIADRALTDDQARPEDFKQQILSLQPGLGSRQYEMARPEVIRSQHDPGTPQPEAQSFNFSKIVPDHTSWLLEGWVAFSEPVNGMHLQLFYSASNLNRFRATPREK